MRQMPHTVLLCLPLVFIRYMSVCAAHRKLHFSSSPLLTAAYAYTVSACLAATAPLVRRSPRPAPNRLRRTRVARARRPSSPAPPAPTPRVRIRRAHIAHAPCRAPILRAPPKPARLADEVLKLQTFSFYQSISNFVVSLPNGGEKDVKGLLFRK